MSSLLVKWMSHPSQQTLFRCDVFRRMLLYSRMAGIILPASFIVSGLIFDMSRVIVSAVGSSISIPVSSFDERSSISRSSSGISAIDDSEWIDSWLISLNYFRLSDTYVHEDAPPSGYPRGNHRQFLRHWHTFYTHYIYNRDIGGPVDGCPWAEFYNFYTGSAWNSSVDWLVKSSRDWTCWGDKCEWQMNGALGAWCWQSNQSQWAVRSCRHLHAKRVFYSCKQLELDGHYLHLRLTRTWQTSNAGAAIHCWVCISSAKTWRWTLSRSVGHRQT